MHLVRRFPQVHRAIGLLGNALFITGSVLFLAQKQHLGLLAFLGGSIGMFVGGLGRRRLERYEPDRYLGAQP